MRTTLTLDDDVAVLLKKVQKKRSLGLKQIVNQALREGLLRIDQEAPLPLAYRMTPVDAGRCLIPDIDCVGEVLSLIEGEAHP